MLPTQHRFVLPGLAALCALFLVMSSGIAKEFTTSSGKTLNLPEIASLSCDAMEDTLAAIDATHYRKNQPKPRNADDKPLHIYEEKLANAHYDTCINQISGAVEPTPAPK